MPKRVATLLKDSNLFCKQHFVRPICPGILSLYSKLNGMRSSFFWVVTQRGQNYRTTFWLPPTSRSYKHHTPLSPSPPCCCSRPSFII